MAVDVTTELVIAAPIDVVASYAADPSKVPVWYKNIESVEVALPETSAGRLEDRVHCAFHGPHVALHLRERRTHPEPASRHANRRRSVPDGDDLHLARARRGNLDDVAESWRTPMDSRE
jgi:hypothetical protein